MAFQRQKPVAIGVKAPFPAFIEPALASSIEKVPSGNRWVHEMMVAGYGLREAKPVFITFRCPNCGRSEKFLWEE